MRNVNIVQSAQDLTERFPLFINYEECKQEYRFYNEESSCRYSLTMRNVNYGRTIGKWVKKALFINYEECKLYILLKSSIAISVIH